MSDYVKIKPIYLPLNNYKFDHGPSDADKPNNHFIGREEIFKRLELILKTDNSKSKNGAYLVTGYRGMGKTSLVREVIKNINSDDINNVKDIEIALTQEEVKETDLLRQIAWKLSRFISDDLDLPNFKVVKPLRKYFTFFLSLLAALFTYNIPCEFWINNLLGNVISCDNWLFNVFANPFKSDSVGFMILFFGILAIYLAIINSFLHFICRIKNNEIYQLITSIVSLNTQMNQRLFSSVSKENDPSSSINYDNNNPVSYLANKILNSFNSNDDLTKSTLSFQKASSKEIEQYLFLLLKKFEELRKKLSPLEEKRQKDIEEKREKGISNNKADKNNKEKKSDIITLAKKIKPFVFIIDELDKIEPEYFINPWEQDKSQTKFQSFNVETKTRIRNEAIASLLANLKNFITTSPAKFVFIGGRGMYDAALADISDRDSFYSSIFNDVIYVPSFFKDKLSSQGSVSQLSEALLCSFLLNERDQKRDYNLFQLVEEYKSIAPNLAENNKELVKILHTLQNFVIYLAYRSNGSPKKVIEIIESFIVNDIPEAIQHESIFVKNYRIKNNNPCLYLRFSYHDQYAINLHSNLYRPYLIINGKHLKMLGDKLLYSSAFLFDHIIKFHKSSFSWRNLEQLPDVILSNKDPNYRQFYNDIMGFLLKQHLRKTGNSLFQYKFNSKITKEIKYSSKISEDNSAAFNFTLDESYHLKSYYKKKLAIKLEEYKSYAGLKSLELYASNISYINGILGDLYYYDEEYDDAILHYSEAIMALSQKIESPIELNYNSFVLKVTNSLSLGLCLEKTRSYDKAYSIYRNIILDLEKFKIVLDRPNTDLPKNGRVKKYSRETSWEGPIKRMQLFQRPHIALLSVIDKDRQDGITYDNLERNFKEYLDFLQIGLERSRYLFPINKGNEVLNYDELNPKSINSYSDKKRNVTLVSDYYFSVGALLFYKNLILYRLIFDRDTHQNQGFEAISSIIKEKLLKNKNSDFYHPSQAAYIYYLHSLITFNVPYHEDLRNFTTTLFSNTQPNDLKNSLSWHLHFMSYFVDSESYKILNSDQLDFLGNILAKLGDALLACLSKSCSDKNEDCKKALVFFTSESVTKDELSYYRNELQDALCLTNVVVLYRLSYLCYKLADKTYSAIFQYKKVLYVIKDTKWSDPIQNENCALKKDNKLFEQILKEDELEKIVLIALRNQSTISGISNRSQLNKYRHYFESYTDLTPEIYDNLSTSPEVVEYLLIYETLMIQFGYQQTSKFYIGSYSTVSSMFTRMLELKFKSNECLNYIKGKANMGKKNFIFDYEKLKDYLENIQRKGDFKEIANIRTNILNSIFSLHQIIRSLNTYGIDYMLNHSFKAVICVKMAETVTLYHIFRDFEKKYNVTLIIEKDIVALLGKSILYALDPFEYYDVALDHYNKAISLHTEGNVYKELSKEMYFLDDDYNDNLIHFCAANERYRMNQGHFHNAIAQINDILMNSKINKINNYVGSTI